MKASGWLLLRAWSEKSDPDLPDLYPYVSTNPIYIVSETKNIHQKKAADYFLKWVTRLESKANDLPYRNESEKETVMQDIRNAKDFYQQRVR